VKKNKTPERSWSGGRGCGVTMGERDFKGVVVEGKKNPGKY